jgi:hypothetical protein
MGRRTIIKDFIVAGVSELRLSSSSNNNNNKILVITTAVMSIAMLIFFYNIAYGQLMQTPENWDPMQVGPTPLPPPTNDPQLLKYDQLFSDCKTLYHDKVIQGIATQQDIYNYGLCVQQIREWIGQYCGEVAGFIDTARCPHVNRLEVQKFLTAANQLLYGGSSSSSTSTTTSQPQQQQQNEQITFKLQGSHMEATVSEVLKAVGYNMTEFQPLDNGTIIVSATAMQ